METPTPKEIKVYTNSELRDVIKSLNLLNKQLSTLSVALNFKKWCSYESNVDFVGLSFKDYPFVLKGIIEEKNNVATLHLTGGDSEENFKFFLDQIKEYEINILENFLEYDFEGEKDGWNFSEIEWMDDTPDEIQNEIKELYEKNNFKDLVDWDKVEYNGEGGVFYKNSNNIHSIEITVLEGLNNQVNIVWLNNFEDAEEVNVKLVPEQTKTKEEEDALDDLLEKAFEEFLKQQEDEDSE